VGFGLNPELAFEIYYDLKSANLIGLNPLKSITIQNKSCLIILWGEITLFLRLLKQVIIQNKKQISNPNRDKERGRVVRE
jgi:hypothetical protein